MKQGSFQGGNAYHFLITLKSTRIEIDGCESDELKINSNEYSYNKHKPKSVSHARYACWRVHDCGNSSKGGA